ncbi:MAG: AMP-binding protein [Chloroflexi bacterium]|nr:AMP-binding protein [Chloroflexota bacterium]
METLLDLLDEAVARFGERPALGIRRDDGTSQGWTYSEFARRARIAAWRLRSLGLEPGDRLLTWSPSCPELAAAYFGAMRARLVIVPLDLRMSTDAIEGIVRASDARHLVLGTGRDAPDPRDARLEVMPTTTVDALCADPDGSFPQDWEAQLATWPRPAPADIWELVFTSGTTGTPKGVMLGHDNVSASIATFHLIVPPMEHRIVSLLPLSHLLEQAVGLFYAMSVGADILYVRSRNPRVIFEALREHRVTTLIVVPQVLDLFWSAIEREVEKRGRLGAFNMLRAIGRRLPAWVRRRLFSSVHAHLGGHFRLFLSSGAFLPPALQQSWEDLGVTVLQGYGATETGTGTCTTLTDHVPGTVGRPPEGVSLRLAEDGEVQFSGPTLFHGYWNAPEKTAEAFTPDGWYRTGDIGRLDDGRRLILSGRKKDIIVLPNGFNVYPEDIENALRIAGIRDSVVLETSPGRIEAVVLAPGTHGLPQAGSPASNPPSEAATAPPASSPGVAPGGAPGGRQAAEIEDPAETRRRIDVAVKAANSSLGPNQRIAAWRLWPEIDFPRTHTLKVKRDRVRAWAAVETPLPTTEAGGTTA